MATIVFVYLFATAKNDTFNTSIIMVYSETVRYPVHYLELADAGKIAYLDEGKGTQTIVFVHGLANYSLSWARNIEMLREHFRCIAIDLPGNGYSDKNGPPYSIQFFARCVADFIRQLNLSSVILAGHSMGGQIAITTLLHYPQLAQKLVLCAPAGLEQFTEIEKNLYRASLSFWDMFASEESNLRKSIRSSFFQYTTQADGMINDLVALMATYPPKGYRRMVDTCIQAMLDEPVYERLGEITQPVLVLFGERDALIPNRIIHPVTTKHLAEQGVARFRHGSLAMIPQCGHFLQWEKATQVNDLIKEFVERDEN
ncbi:alpha/beta fold hydrolase [Chitinophagaceae bacterium MMS25-I14]